MARLLKRWESPRREGRNDKGRGGSARARQLKKREKMLRQKLQERSQSQDKQNNQNSPGGNASSLPIFFDGEVGEIFYSFLHPSSFTLHPLPFILYQSKI